MKKILSLFLTTAMASALFTAPSFAETNGISISGINADPDAIYIYYDQSQAEGFDMSTLKNACTITVNGEDIAADCSYEKVELLPSSAGLNSKYFRGCTAIKRNNGEEFPTNSEISFKAEVTDGVVTKAFNKSFTIYELINDDFSGELNWKAASGSDAPQIKDYTIGNVTDKGLYLPKNVPVVNNDSDKQTDWADYTVTFDIYCENEFNGVFDLYYTESNNVGYEIQNTHSRLRAFLDSNNNTYWLHADSIVTPDAGKLTHYKFSSDVNGSNMRAVASREEKIFIDYSIHKQPKGIPTFQNRNDLELYMDNVRITKMISNDSDVELTFDVENADTDGITIYPKVNGGAVDFDAAELGNYVSLRNDTDDVDIPVKVEIMTNTSSYRSSYVRDKPYVVKRTDGKQLEADKDYTLTVNRGPITTSLVALNKPFVKKFRLTKVFSDDFSGTGDNSGADNLKWTWVNYNNSANFTTPTTTIEDGALVIDAITEGRLVPVNYNEMLGLKDCTVKFDIKSAEGSDRKFLTSFTKQANTLDLCDNHTDFEVQNTQLRVRVNNCLVLNSSTGKYESNAWHGDYTHDDSALTYGETETYKLSGKGLKYSLYRNGVRLAALCETDESYSAVGAFALRFWTGKVSLDNIIVTRMESIPEEIKISDAAITVGDSELDSVAGQVSANITAKIRNTYTTDKNATVVVAVYKSKGDMTNVVCMNNVTLREGNNSIPFENMAIDGGEKIKVFVFENLNNLKPYCKSITK